MILCRCNAGPIAAVAVAGTCCSAQWWRCLITIPFCIASCASPAPFPNPSDPTMICQTATAFALIAPNP